MRKMKPSESVSIRPVDVEMAHATPLVHVIRIRPPFQV